jgi:hypothetical protein
MRQRERILASLEAAYREAFDQAKARDDMQEMARLDFQFQRDQINLEVLLDIRDLVLPAEASPPPSPKEGKSLIEEGTALVEKAQALRRITRLR